MSVEQINALLDPHKLIGRCPNQVTEYLDSYVYPTLDYFSDEIKDILTQVNV